VNITVSTSGGSSAPATFTIQPASHEACANNGSGNSKLKGAYAFQFSQTDPTRNGQLTLNVGSFTADGSGNIAAGSLDTNSPSNTSAVQETFTGNYSVGPDDRGSLTVTYSGGTTSYFCFALDSFANGVAGSARLVSDDTNKQVDSGAFFAQGAGNLTLASVKGSWAYGLQGVKLDPTNGEPTRGAAAGYLTLDGNGNVTAGEQDVSQDKYESGTLVPSYTPQVSVSGTYTLASNGRGTLSDGKTGTYVFYLAGPSQILLLSTGGGGEGGDAVVAGRAYLRTTSTFSNSTLTGTSVFVGQGLSDTASSYYDNRYVQAGIVTWNGTGSESETFDRNDAGTVTLKQASSGSYAVDADGRVTLNGTSPSTYAYLVGPNQGFAVRGDLGVSFEYFEKQTVPIGGFALTSFEGGYSDGSIWYGFEQQKARSGEIVSNGTAGLTGTVDVDPILNGVVDTAPEQPGLDDPLRSGPIDLYQITGESYTASASGRFVVTKGSQLSEVLYFVSSSRAYAIDISGAPWQPLEELNHQ
jgi:hypothetical protein